MADISQVRVNNTDYNFADDTKVPYDLLQDTVGFTSKNALQFSFYEGAVKVEKGITFTVNSDNSVTINGVRTGTGQAYYRINERLPKVIQPGKYIISVETTDNNIRVGVDKANNNTFSYMSSYISFIVGNGEKEFTYPVADYNEAYPRIFIQINAGLTINNAVVKVMLRKADIMDSTYEQYNPSVKQVLRNNKIIEGKNLIPFPYEQTTKTSNGITWTDNGDGTITANGTATANSWFSLLSPESINKLNLQNGDYILSGCPSGGGSSLYEITFGYNNTGGTQDWFQDYGRGKEFTLYPNNFSSWYGLQVGIRSGQTVSNLTFKPMLRKATELDSTYEQYYIPGVVSQEAQNILGAKNLIKYPYDDTTKTTGGVTFTDNGDGSITVSGTATEDINYFLFRQTTINRNTLLNKRLKLTGGINNNIHFYFYNVDGTNSVDDAGNGVEFNFTNASANFNIVLAIRNGTVISTPITIYPMLRLAEIQDDTWTPYARTNKDLTDNIFIKRELLNVDLNDITDYGMYSIQTGVTNSPESITYATLIVGPGSSVIGSPTRTQMVYKTQNLYVRTKVGSPAVWSPWYKFTGTEVSS